MKKALLMILALMLALPLTGCLSVIRDIAKADAKSDKEFDAYCPGSYSGKDLYSSGVRDFTIFDRYYYDSDISGLLLETGLYAEVGNDNRGAVLSRVQLVEEIMDGAGEIGKFDFDYSAVTADDVYAIDENGSLFYYDKGKDILYYVRQDF